MAEFLIRTNNGEKEKAFFNKLNKNFNNINSKNMLLDRSLSIFKKKDEKDIYALVEITPIIPNVALYGSAFSFILYTIFLFFNKNWYFFLIMGCFLTIISLCWTKQFFYKLLARSMKKYGIKKMEMI